MKLEEITQTISEKLRYRDLSALVGCSVKINAFSSIESDIKLSFESILPTSCELVDFYNPIVSIRKLGFLTLHFIVSPAVLASDYETGTELLKKLNYVGNPEVQNYWGAWAARFIKDLLEDINRDRTYFMIEIKPHKNPEPPNRTKGKGPGWYFNAPLPDDYFPHFFKVKRACFANSKLVWLYEHGVGVSIL